MLHCAEVAKIGTFVGVHRAIAASSLGEVARLALTRHASGSPSSMCTVHTNQAARLLASPVELLVRILANTVL